MSTSTEHHPMTDPDLRPRSTPIPGAEAFVAADEVPGNAGAMPPPTPAEFVHAQSLQGGFDRTRSVQGQRASSPPPRRIVAAARRSVVVRHGFVRRRTAHLAAPRR
jgi:hypothetical protein